MRGRRRISSTSVLDLPDALLLTGEPKGSLSLDFCLFLATECGEGDFLGLCFLGMQYELLLGMGEVLL